MIWPEGWKPFEIGDNDDGLVREFRREAHPNHILASLPLRTVGTHHADNVLFEVLDGSGRFAAVHLTYSKSQETDPRWPDTKIYEDWQHFEQEGADF